MEDFNSIDIKKKNDKKDEDPNNATNFPDEKNKANKVNPEDTDKKEGVIQEEEDTLKDEVDSPGFIKKLGVEPYIRFADFAKYLSLFNQRTGLDEKI